MIPLVASQKPICLLCFPSTIPVFLQLSLTQDLNNWDLKSFLTSIKQLSSMTLRESKVDNGVPMRGEVESSGPHDNQCSLTIKLFCVSPDGQMNKGLAQPNNNAVTKMPVAASLRHSHPRSACLPAPLLIGSQAPAVPCSSLL